MSTSNILGIHPSADLVPTAFCNAVTMSRFVLALEPSSFTTTRGCLSGKPEHGSFLVFEAMTNAFALPVNPVLKDKVTVTCSSHSHVKHARTGRAGFLPPPVA